MLPHGIEGKEKKRTGIMESCFLGLGDKPAFLFLRNAAAATVVGGDCGGGGRSRGGDANCGAKCAL